MNVKLLSENEKTFTVEANGNRVVVAKTPGNAKLLAQLQSTMGKEPKGKVPGRAPVKGDSPKNDLININVSGGEGIIPRTSMETREKAIAFVNKMFTEQGKQTGNAMNKGGKVCYADGGVVGGAEEEEEEEESQEDKDKKFAAGANMLAHAFDGLANPRSYADGGIVQGEKEEKEEKEDADDYFEKATEPTAIAGGNYKGGIVKRPGYFDGGEVIDEEDIAVEPLSPTPPLTVPTVPQVDPAVSSKWNTPGATNVNFVPTQTGGATGSWASTTGTEAEPGANPPVQGQEQSNDPSGIGSLRTTQTETKIPDKKGAAALDNAKKEYDEAAKLLWETNQEEIRAVRNEREAFNTAIEEKQREHQLMEQMRQDEIRRKGAEVDKVEREALDARIDGTHLWSEGGGSRVMAGLGLILGGFGQAFSGKENPAIGVIERAIDRDIQVQKANAAQKNAAASIKNNQFSRYKQILGDEKAAEDALRATMYKDVERRIDLIAAKSAEGKNNAMLMKTKADIQEKYADKRFSVGGTIQRITDEQKAAKPRKEMEQGDRDKYDAKTALLQKLSDMRELKKAVDTGVVSKRAQAILGAMGLGNTDFAKLQAQGTDIMATYGKSQFGAMAAEERKLADQVVPGSGNQDNIWNAKWESMDAGARKDFERFKTSRERMGFYVPSFEMTSSQDDEKQKAGFKPQVKK